MGARATIASVAGVAVGVECWWLAWLWMQGLGWLAWAVLRCGCRVLVAGVAVGVGAGMAIVVEGAGAKMAGVAMGIGAVRVTSSSAQVGSNLTRVCGPATRGC